MEKKAIIVVVVALAVLAVGLTWFLLPRQANDPRLHLNVVRQTVEQGQPVVFFRVEGGTNRRIAISRVSRVIVEPSNSWTLSSAHELDEFRGLVPPGPIHVMSAAESQGQNKVFPQRACPQPDLRRSVDQPVVRFERTRRSAFPLQTKTCWW